MQIQGQYDWDGLSFASKLAYRFEGKGWFKLDDAAQYLEGRPRATGAVHALRELGLLVTEDGWHCVAPFTHEFPKRTAYKGAVGRRAVAEKLGVNISTVYYRQKHGREIDEEAGYVEYNGIRGYSALGRAYGIHPRTLWYRVNTKGMSLADAVTQPISKQHSHRTRPIPVDVPAETVRAKPVLSENMRLALGLASATISNS